VEFQSVKSVDVLGDCRRHAWGMALLAMETIDFTCFRDANV
jgi:GMP synthase PP-ATPase subunit